MENKNKRYNNIKMIGFYSGGGKTRKIMGKQRIFRRTGFLEKHTNSEGKIRNTRYKRRFYNIF